MKILGTLHANLIKLYNYLTIYGFEKYKAKEDLTILIFLSEITTSDYYNTLKQCERDGLIEQFKYILNNNDFLVHSICNPPTSIFDDAYEVGVIIEAILTEDNEYMIMTEDRYVITYE